MYVSVAGFALKRLASWQEIAKWAMLSKAGASCKQKLLTNQRATAHADSNFPRQAKLSASFILRKIYFAQNNYGGGA
ncbi:hypothetical protein [Vogesella oryzae]|uniref:hypothetical protein n=1 Tax=Vogesella oryzae TaxID=1735285 RepID=UPI00158237B9|nr:hypothetical protein [Vogesella oryzae]